MAREEKPYRIYRGGRTKGKVPTTGRRVGTGPTAGATTPPPYRGPGARPERRRRRLGLWVTLGALMLVVLIALWGVFGYLSVSHGVSDANGRLDPDAKAALQKQNGLLYSHSTTILLLGTDNSDLA